MTSLFMIHRFVKQKPYKTTTLLLWAKQRGTFLQAKGKNPFIKHLFAPGEARDQKTRTGNYFEM